MMNLLCFSELDRFKCKENVNNTIKIMQLSRNLRKSNSTKITRLPLKITWSLDQSKNH